MLGDWMKKEYTSGGIIGRMKDNATGAKKQGQVPGFMQQAAGNMFKNTQNQLQSMQKPKNNQNNNQAFQAPNYSTPEPQKAGPGGYRATTAPYGMDQTMPGAGEQMWENNQNMWFNSPSMDWNQTQSPSNANQQTPQSSFAGPGAGSQFWNQVSGSFNQVNQDLTPQFDAYYDRARDNALGAANSQAAARGAYGSSAALNNVGNVINDFEANRGKAYTDFMLENEANKRENLGLYGSLAFGAGKENLGYSTDQLNRLNSAFGNAMSAQGARDNRIQSMFNNLAFQQGQIVPWSTGQYEGLFGSDQAAMGGATDAALGRAQQNQNYAAGARANAESGLTGGLSLGTGIAQLGRSGGQQPPPQSPPPSPGLNISYNPYRTPR